MTTVTPHRGRVVMSEHAFRQYALDIEPGVTLADLLRPEMWRLNTSGQLRPRDRVRVIAKDDAFDCLLVVKAVLPDAGVIMAVYGADTAAGTPMGDTLRAAEAAARAEEEATRRADIEAAIAGGHP